MNKEKNVTRFEAAKFVLEKFHINHEKINSSRDLESLYHYCNRYKQYYLADNEIDMVDLNKLNEFIDYVEDEKGAGLFDITNDKRLKLKKTLHKNINKYKEIYGSKEVEGGFEKENILLKSEGNESDKDEKNKNLNNINIMESNYFEDKKIEELIKENKELKLKVEKLEREKRKLFSEIETKESNYNALIESLINNAIKSVEELSNLGLLEEKLKIKLTKIVIGN